MSSIRHGPSLTRSVSLFVAAKFPLISGVVAKSALMQSRGLKMQVTVYECLENGRTVIVQGYQDQDVSFNSSTWTHSCAFKTARLPFEHFRLSLHAQEKTTAKHAGL